MKKCTFPRIKTIILILVQVFFVFTSLYLVPRVKGNSINIDATVTHLACYGAATGAIDISVTGGVPDYLYNWSNGATSADISGLSAGSYTVTVTDAMAGTSTGAWTVTQPNLLVATASVVMHVDCYGNQTGSTTVNASGGTPGYSYLWSSSQTTQTISGLMEDTYYVLVTDANGCTALSQATVTQPPVLMVSAQITPVSCNGNSDGAISTTAQGGTPGYSYLWTTGQTTSAISGLTAGKYRVTVTDSHACTMQMNLNVTQPNVLPKIRN